MLHTLWSLWLLGTGSASLFCDTDQNRNQAGFLEATTTWPQGVSLLNAHSQLRKWFLSWLSTPSRNHTISTFSGEPSTMHSSSPESSGRDPTVTALFWKDVCGAALARGVHESHASEVKECFQQQVSSVPVSPESYNRQNSLGSSLLFEDCKFGLGWRHPQTEWIEDCGFSIWKSQSIIR